MQVSKIFGPVVLRQSDYRLHRHTDVHAAAAEAERLTQRTGGTFAVYVPVIVCRPAGVERTVLDTVDGRIASIELRIETMLTIEEEEERQVA